MKITLYEKKYRKSAEHDGTVPIKPDFFNREKVYNAYTETPHYGDVIDQVRGGTKRGVVDTTKVLDLKALKKEFPTLAKVKIGDLQIRL